MFPKIETKLRREILIYLSSTFLNVQLATCPLAYAPAEQQKKVRRIKKAYRHTHRESEIVPFKFKLIDIHFKTSFSCFVRKIFENFIFYKRRCICMVSILYHIFIVYLCCFFCSHWDNIYAA